MWVFGCSYRVFGCSYGIIRCSYAIFACFGVTLIRDTMGGLATFIRAVFGVGAHVFEACTAGSAITARRNGFLGDLASPVLVRLSDIVDEFLTPNYLPRP